MEIGLSPGHIVLELVGDSAPQPRKWHSSLPNFSAHVYCGQTAGWIKLSLGMAVGFGPADIVLDGVPSSIPSPPPKGV